MRGWPADLKGEEEAVVAASAVIVGDKMAEYSWVPPGLPSNRVEEYMRQLPMRKVPRIGSEGERYRESQLSLQIPKQDISIKYCSHVDLPHQASYEAFVAARNSLALDVGHVLDYCKSRVTCAACFKTIPSGSVAVVAPKLPQNLYHPACFVCKHCQELLVDLTYCAHEDTLYCERHYAEKLKPRCGLCQELIFAGSYTKALNRNWHSHHFSCWHCDTSLTGKRYVLTDDHPCCIPCYENHFTNVCNVCTKKIGLDCKDMSYKELHWHEACFCCHRCSESLIDKAFAVRNEKSFCGSCYDKEFSSRCEACSQVFLPGTRKIEYKGRQWHDVCFHCKVCTVKVGSKSFIIPNDKDIYCVKCFEDKIATKCTKCKNILTSGGVTFRNEPWHKECFVCQHCGCQLAGQKFASREEKPYCANCFGELFAKRCASCSKPITGQGGTRFISFEGRHWHSNCFVCSLCTKSMAGKGFITDGEDIICPECAREKLMGP